MLLIIKRNFCFDVNSTWETTLCVTLYCNCFSRIGRGCGEKDPRRRDCQEPERPRQPGVLGAVQEHSGDSQVVEAGSR